MNKDRYSVQPDGGKFQIIDGQTGKLVETLDTLPVADAICKQMNENESERQKPRIGW